MFETIMTGTGLALITPFKEDFSIDFDALANLIEYTIEGGVEYLVALGTTGESVTLTKDEKKQVYAFIAQQAKGRVAVVAGIGGNNTAEVIEQFGLINPDHFDAILSVSPYYNKPNQQGILNHYMAIEKHSPLPIILYNVPGRTGSNMSVQTTLTLANASDKFIAIKEASGNAEQFMDLLNEKPADFNIISGDDNLTLPFLAMGMSGVISVIGQAYPKAFSTMVRLGLDGRFEEARQLHYTYYNLMKSIFADGNPGGIKALLCIMGICKNVLRMPLTPVNEQVFEKLNNLHKQVLSSI
ncbi:MAG: 4-hydroxy-tetrahydrodipicolinate synthase [Bacteroidia bacterium]